MKTKPKAKRKPKPSKRKPRKVSPTVQRIGAVPILAEIDDEPWGDDGLTLKQRLFVAAIVGPAAGNASKAARLAGYRSENIKSLHQTAHDTLTSPHVQQAIRQALAKRATSAEWAEAELASIAHGDLARFIRVDAQGVATIDWQSAMASGSVGLIREIDLDENGKPKKIRLHDRVKALEMVLKLHGKLIDKHELSGPGGKPLALVMDTGLVSAKESQ